MFADRYIERVIKTKSHLCVGLDPDLKKYPTYILKQAEVEYGRTPAGAASAILRFNKEIIDLIYDKVPAIKPQLAYYEKYDSFGVDAFWKTVEYAQSKGMIVIADAKRGDIGDTSNAYAETFFKSLDKDSWESKLSVDAVTVNPYLGSDGLNPFIKLGAEKNKGTIILVKTSNLSSGEIQDNVIEGKNQTVSELVCDYINNNIKQVGKYGYSDIAAVIGATYPEELKKFRTILRKSLFLVPGLGYQGGSIEDIKYAFDEKGLGAILTSSRAINYAYKDIDSSEEEVKTAILNKVIEDNNAINAMLKKEDKLLWKNIIEESKK
jgi:orotidine 5'-phosphate decarboxylase